MWRSYEKYLIDIYIPIHMWAWGTYKKKNGEPYSNKKSLEKWSNLSAMVRDRDLVIPMWITTHFIESHRSNLIRKNHGHYWPIFSNTKLGLSYIWPNK
jgi:hypothetical protein